jgi:predicted esterase
MPRASGLALSRLLSMAVALAAFAAAAAPFKEGLNEFRVELPAELRSMAGRGKASPVTHAAVTVAVPSGFSAGTPAPILVVSATSGRSSRDLLQAYARAAAESGWILVAADAEPPVPLADDQVPLRLALATAAVAGLRHQWPASADSPLAFGGFSGGAKYSGWLAASFAKRGRNVVGVYFSGTNEDTLSAAAAHFEIKDERFKRVAVFVQAGARDEVAGPEDHKRVVASLQRAGFERVKLTWTSGGHEIAPESLRGALDWFGAR